MLCIKFVPYRILGPDKWINNSSRALDINSKASVAILIEYYLRWLFHSSEYAIVVDRLGWKPAFIECSSFSGSKLIYLKKLRGLA